MLSCPGCGTLRHADELKRLAAAAQQAPPSEALGLWRQAIGLLPRDSQQYSLVAAKIEAISRSLETSPAGTSQTGGGQWKGTAAGVGVLLIGLTKMGTLLSMFASLGFYWQFYGWQLALGVILCIYVHEMGHVFALKRLGIQATAPMFIPGFGALILLKQNYFSPREDARHGLAGPLWGLGASVFTTLLGLALHSPVCLLIAQWNAWINLANLTPVWSLDGARGFHALKRKQRIIASLIFTASWLPLAAQMNLHNLAGPSLTLGMRVALLAAAASIYGILQRNEPDVSDRRALWHYVGLCLALTAFNWLPVPPAAG